MQQSQISDSSDNQKSQTTNKNKQRNAFEDDVAAVALFLAAGVVFHFFASDVNIPSWNWFFQAISHLCYVVGFIGSFISIDNHSKRKGLADIAIGIVIAFLALILHLFVLSVREISTFDAIVLEVLFAVFVCAASYGIIKGIICLLKCITQPIENNQSSERIKIGDIANYAIGALSLLLTFIQALPIIITYITSIFHK